MDVRYVYARDILILKSSQQIAAILSVDSCSYLSDWLSIVNNAICIVEMHLHSVLLFIIFNVVLKKEIFGTLKCSLFAVLSFSK